MAPSRLLLMPREIRDLIYRFTFAGSRLYFGSSLMNTCCRWHVEGHVETLFACNMCYEEARYAFWEEVIVYGYEGFPRTTIYELSQNLGEFAKSRIRHLRRLCAGLDCNRNDTTEIKTGLDQFPRLKTCEFFGSPFVYGGPLSELSKSDDEQTWINFATSRQFSDGNPHKTLKDDWKIDVKQYNIVFLMRFTVIYINAFMPYMTQAKRIWVNMTTKKYFIKRPSGVSIHMDDEEGFRCVLAESPQRRTSNKVQGEDDGYANVE